MKKLILTFVLVMAVSLAAFAQYDQAKNALGVRATFLNYQYPITENWLPDDFTVGAEVEYVRHLNNALNLSIPLKFAKSELPLDEMGNTNDATTISLDALLQLKLFKESNFIYPYIYGGIGAMNEEFEDFTFAAPAGVGLNFRLATHTYLSFKGEYRFGFDDLRDNIQIGSGLLILLGEGPPEEPEVQDRDGDGVPDNQDLCPDAAGPASLNGCPDADGDGVADGEDECPDGPGERGLAGCPDSDGDGIADKDDECPDEAGTPENNGCPVRDVDGDGVPDDQDACPNDAGKVSLNGCPDGDNDGIADRDDRCPNQAGPAATGGCPDRDGDGVVDSSDRCPNSPGPASNNGCPEVEEEDRETLEFATKAVQFETAKSTLKPESFEVLNQIVEILQRYPDYKMRISGHTDSVGSAASNQELSERRAKACYDYLVAKGIDPERLSYEGFGESQPIADNRYREGREQNRRVEFDIYLDEN